MKTRYHQSFRSDAFRRESVGRRRDAHRLLGEPAQAPTAQRAVVTAAYARTIDIAGGTKWVNVNHGEVVRFVANGREFTWYFDGVSQPRPFDLSEIAPAGFVDHGVKVYVGLGDDANLG